MSDLTFSLGVWKPIFPDDELPASFPKNLRRPIAERQPFDGYGGDDEDEDDADLEDMPDDDETIETKATARAESSKPDRRKAVAKSRVTGGRPAIPKQVVADLDSDDEIIKEMKELGYKDEAVRDRLIREGRTKYEAKTISTRYIRIKRVLAAHEEKFLDEELTDWHDGDDDRLLEAYEEAREQTAKELDELVKRQWTLVAENLKKKMPVPKFSRNACKDRHEALMAGTAVIPPELDPNPEARQEQRLARLEERNRAKLAEMEKVRLAQEEKQQAREEEQRAAATAKAQRNELRMQAKEKRAAAKAERQALRVAQAEARKEALAEKAAAIQQAEEERRAKVQAVEDAKKEKVAQRQREKNAKAERIVQERLKKAEVAREEQEAKLKALHNEHIYRDIIHAHMQDVLNGAPGATYPDACGIISENEVVGMSENDDATCPTRKFSNEYVEQMTNCIWGAPVAQMIASSLASTNKRKHVSNPSDATASTAGSVPGNSSNPRAAMTADALRSALRDRGHSVGGRKEELLKRLTELDLKMSLQDLQKTCAQRKLKTTGTRSILRYRIACADAEAANLAAAQILPRTKKVKVVEEGKNVENVVSDRLCEVV